MQRTIFCAIFLFAALAARAESIRGLLDAALQAPDPEHRAAAAAALTSACAVPTLSALDGALCQHGLGVLDDLRGNLDSAEVHLRRALSAWDDMPNAPQHWRVNVQLSLGEVLSRRGHYDEALRIFTSAASDAKSLASVDVSLYPQTLSRLGLLHGEMDHPDVARKLLLDAIAAFGAAPATDRAELAYAWNSLASVELRTGAYGEAEDHARRAVSLATASLGEMHPETAAYQTSLALALIGQGRYSGAEILLRRARFIVEKRLGPDHPQLGSILIELSTAQLASGAIAGAEESARRAVAIVTRDSGATSLPAAQAQVNLAGILLAKKKVAEAGAILPAAIETERRLLPPDRILADGLRHLAELRVAEQAWGQAEALYRESLGIYEASLGPAHPDIAPVLLAWADTLRHQHAPRAEVRSVEARARALVRPAPRG